MTAAVHTAVFAVVGAASSADRALNPSLRQTQDRFWVSVARQIDWWYGPSRPECGHGIVRYGCFALLLQLSNSCNLEGCGLRVSHREGYTLCSMFIS